MRSEVRSKRRRTNMILNGLIALVLLLIVIVSVSIFSNDDETETQKDQAIEEKRNDSPAEKTTKEVKQETSKQSKSTQSDSKTKDKDTKKDKKQESDTEVITEGGGDNVQRMIVNPAWEPVGTTQSGPNSSESVDWDERVKALASAIGADESTMTVWYLSRDGGPDKSIGTVTEKGNPQAYRVYLEWQDEGGWKPVKVEELIENDKVQQ